MKNFFLDETFLLITNIVPLVEQHKVKYCIIWQRKELCLNSHFNFLTAFLAWQVEKVGLKAFFKLNYTRNGQTLGNWLNNRILIIK